MQTSNHLKIVLTKFFPNPSFFITVYIHDRPCSRSLFDRILGLLRRNAGSAHRL